MRTTVVAAVLIGASAVGGCSSAREIGACGTYVDTPGTAFVTAVQPAPPGENNCPNDPVKVTFDFIPDEPSQAAKAINGWSVTIGDGKNPPSAAVAACQLGVGSSHPAVRSDEQGGSCTPVVVTLSDLGGAECQAALGTCFQ